MKHRKLYLILLLLSQGVFGQMESKDPEFNDKISKLFIANKIDFQLDSAGFSTLPTIDYDCSINASGQFWHVIDLNADGHKDLIYSGLCQPYYQSAVFLNDGTKLTKVYDAPGKLVAIDLHPFDSKVFIHKSSTGCDYYSSLSVVTIKDENSTTVEEINYHFDTKISLKKKFKESVISGILRTEPIENDTIQEDPCTNESLTGNQILTLKEKSATVVDSKKNWFLVYYQINEKNAILGWIKKEKG